MRLRQGFGTLCDPVHTGFVQVFHAGEWGALCGETRLLENGQDNLVADVVCRQLGFPHGTRIDPIAPGEPAPAGDYDYTYDYASYTFTEEGGQPSGRVWVNRALCRGPEERLLDCELGDNSRRFLPDGARCEGFNNFGGSRVHIACRQFPVVEALEAVSTPGAGATTCATSLNTRL